MTLEEDGPPTRSANVVRDLSAGVASIAFILWITFFSTAGFVEVTMLGMAVALLIWFATVEPSRLLDSPKRPSAMLFFLATLGLAVMLTGALILATATMLFATALGVIAVVIGLARALTHGYHERGGTFDGFL